MRRVIRSSRRGLTTLAAAVLLGVVLAPASSAQEEGGEAGDDADAGEESEAQEAEELEDTDLSGYRLRSEATPFAVLVWEPLMPFPVEPGDPHLALQAAYSRTTLNTGPTGRALSSYLWPGAALGDGGIEQIIQQEFDYPMVVNARVPQGPEEDELEVAPGAGMYANADGTDVRARTGTSEMPSDAFAVGAFSSDSRSYVEDGQAVTTARSVVSDAELLGGLVRFDGITTELEARGDGASAETSGATKVAGLTIAGFGFSLDEDGLRPEGGQGQDLGLPLGLSGKTPDELREMLGIEIELLGHEETVEEAESERSAGGVRVSLDTSVLRETLMLDDLLRPLVGTLPDELRNPPLPDEVPVNPVDLLFVEPRVDIVLARATVEANTTEALDLDFDMGLGDDVEAGGGDDLGGDVGGGTGTADAPDLDTGGGEAGESADLPAADTADGGGEQEPPPEDPEVAGDPESSSGMQAAAGQLPPGAGSPLAAVALALATAAIATRGLQGMTGLVFGGAAGCDGGHPTGVPDLKEESS